MLYYAHHWFLALPSLKLLSVGGLNILNLTGAEAAVDPFSDNHQVAKFGKLWLAINPVAWGFKGLHECLDHLIHCQWGALLEQPAHAEDERISLEGFILPLLKFLHVLEGRSNLYVESLLLNKHLCGHSMPRGPSSPSGQIIEVNSRLVSKSRVISTS